MSSLARPRPPSGTAILTAAVALAALVGADELGSPHHMLLGFSLDIANVRISIQAEASDFKRE